MAREASLVGGRHFLTNDGYLLSGESLLAVDLHKRGIHIGCDNSAMTLTDRVFTVAGGPEWGCMYDQYRWDACWREWRNNDNGIQMYVFTPVMFPDCEFTAGWWQTPFGLACMYTRSIICASRGPAVFAVRKLQRSFRLRIARQWDQMMADVFEIAKGYVKGKGGFVRKSNTRVHRGACVEPSDSVD
jgi:hypothetical protein